MNNLFEIFIGIISCYVLGVIIYFAIQFFSINKEPEMIGSLHIDENKEPETELDYNPKLMKEKKSNLDNPIVKVIKRKQTKKPTNKRSSKTKLK